MQVTTLIMCPRCGGLVPEPSPADAGRAVYTCPRCGTLLQAHPAVGRARPCLMTGPVVTTMWRR